MGDRYGRACAASSCPVTGAYTFWIATDDGGELFLSSDESVLRKGPSRPAPRPRASGEWTRFPSCKSAPIVLTAESDITSKPSRRMAAEGDHLAVG